MSEGAFNQEYFLFTGRWAYFWQVAVFGMRYNWIFAYTGHYKFRPQFDIRNILLLNPLMNTQYIKNFKLLFTRMLNQ